MTVSDMLIKTSESDRLARAECLGDGYCVTSFSDPNHGYPCVGIHCSSIPIISTLSVLQANGRLQRHGFDPDVEYSGVGEKSGVRLFHAEGHIAWGGPGFGLFNAGEEARTSGDAADMIGRTYDYETYGAWLDHSAFWVVHDLVLSGVYRGGIGGGDNVDNLSGWELAYGASVGNDTGTRPTGNATWSGIMVGITGVNGPLQAIRGDASLSYNVGQNHLDVAFTNVRNLDTRTSFTDMQWYDLPVGSDGSFRRRTYNAVTLDTHIDGRFYGPGHAEVGGNFHHLEADVVGAFGAKRQ